MSGQPEVIWARLDNATLYADGSSPCVARTKEFANGTKYVRAASSQAEIERLKALEAELWRLSLVIESAVRNADRPNHADVLALIKSIKRPDAALSGSKE